MSLLNPEPDKDQLWAIVKALDCNDDGVVSAEEVKVLFSKLLGVPPAEIPDDHDEACPMDMPIVKC